jgi:hypothetical protein
MAIQTINLGNVVNDGLGDDLRTAFEKVNANFLELVNVLDIDAANAQEVGYGIFKEKSESTLIFKNLTAGLKIDLVPAPDGNSLAIDCTQEDAFRRIETDGGSINADDYEFITIQGGTNINVTANNQYITVDTNLDLETIISGYDFGPITNNFTTSIQLALAAANIDFGTILNPGPFNLDLGTL